MVLQDGNVLLVKSHFLKLAENSGWNLVQDYEDAAVLCFCRGNDRLSVYYETATVARCPDHPTVGKMQIFHKQVKWGTLKELFEKNVHLCSQKMYCRRGTGEFGQPEPVLKYRRRWASAGVGNDFDKICADADSMPIVALGRTWFLCDWNGRNFWGSPGVPKLLQETLTERHVSLPRIDVITFGPNKTSFFVQFANGDFRCRGIPESLTVAICSKDCEVQSLALGPNSSYFCLWADGSMSKSRLSSKMEKILLRDGMIVEEVTMGPKGEWFVRFENGDWHCHGHSVECDVAIREIQKMEHTNSIVHIAFGHDKKWIITYE